MFDASLHIKNRTSEARTALKKTLFLSRDSYPATRELADTAGCSSCLDSAAVDGPAPWIAGTAGMFCLQEVVPEALVLHRFEGLPAADRNSVTCACLLGAILVGALRRRVRLGLLCVGCSTEGSAGLGRNDEGGCAECRCECGSG